MKLQAYNRLRKLFKGRQYECKRYKLLTAYPNVAEFQNKETGEIIYV